MKNIIYFGFLIAPLTAQAQETSSASGHAVPQDQPAAAAGARPTPMHNRALGFTVDLLPIALSASAGKLGASGQVWYGTDHLRFRLVGAHLAMPNWLAGKDGFEDQTVDVGAAIVDYVFGDHFRGAWLGTGLEFWHSSMGHVDYPGRRVQWNSGVFTVGGGYIFPILGNFYLEPWAAAHLVLNDPKPRLGEAVYRPMRLSAEASLKVGLFFDL